MMRKNLWILSIMFISMFAFFSNSFAWQGRMAGMGDPYGLVNDESDFLIHPSMLPDGKSMKFYGHYRYTYTDIMDWDLDWDVDIPGTWGSYRASGDEQSHNALLGTTFSLGPGRMGTFFSYDGQRNDYNRNMEASLGTYEYDFENEFDEFALRILYGLPINGFSVGGELGFSYREEESENYQRYPSNIQALGNNFADIYGFTPYDSDYWNAFLKGSVQSLIGHVQTALTIRGGYILSGDNEWKSWVESPVGTTIIKRDLDGDVEGWSVGGDLWIRFPLCEGVTLPHLVRIDYQEKKRDGSGTDTGGILNHYKNTEKQLFVEAGGGFERQCSKTDSRLAAGLYYNYIKNKNDIYWKQTFPGPDFIQESETPHFTEHRAVARFIWEKPLSSDMELRTAMNWFYGHAEKESKIHVAGPVPSTTRDYDRKGPHWGVNIFLGCTVKLNSFSVEPFINGGYEEFDLDGDVNGDFGLTSANGDIDESQKLWFIGGGFSVLLGN